jgi:hypothetical protein
MKERKDRKQKVEEIRIIDGDTRPDKNIEPDVTTKSTTRQSEKRITPARGADVNDLEDFKDAK